MYKSARSPARDTRGTCAKEPALDARIGTLDRCVRLVAVRLTAYEVVARFLQLPDPVLACCT